MASSRGELYIIGICAFFLCAITPIFASNTWNNCSTVSFRYLGFKAAEKNVCVSLDYRDCKTIYITGQADGYDDTFDEEVSVTEFLQSDTYQKSYRTSVLVFTCDVFLNISEIYGSKPNFGGCADYLVLCNNSTVSSGRFSCFQLDDKKCLPPLEQLTTLPPTTTEEAVHLQPISFWHIVYWVVGIVGSLVFVVLMLQVVQCVRNETRSHLIVGGGAEEEELVELSSNAEGEGPKETTATDAAAKDEENQVLEEEQFV